MNSRKQTSAVAQLKKWCEGKPQMLAWLATQVAVSMDATFELLQLCRSENGMFAKRCRIRRCEWLDFYTHHRRWRRGLLTGSGVGEVESDTCESLVDSVPWIARADKACLKASLEGLSEEDWRESLAQGKELWNQQWKLHWDELSGDLEEGMSEQEARHFFREPGVQFFFRVAFPCWVMYGKWPSRMLWIASRGGSVGLSALQDLIRLDNLVVHHSSLDHVLHPSKRTLRQARKSWLNRALSGKWASVSRSRLRYRLGRLIYDVGERIGSPLKTPEISELFRIAALFRTGKTLLAEKPIYPVMDPENWTT
jgi:hypothetical protein